MKDMTNTHKSMKRLRNKAMNKNIAILKITKKNLNLRIETMRKWKIKLTVGSSLAKMGSAKIVQEVVQEISSKNKLS